MGRSPKTGDVLLFRHSPCSDTAVRSFERAGTAAAGKTAGTDDGDIAVMADGTGGAAGADGSAETIPNNPAAGHDDRLCGTAAGGADRVGDPRAVEIAATATATAAASSRICAALPLRACFAGPAARVQPTAYRTGIFRRCRCCRRRCRIARMLCRGRSRGQRRAGPILSGGK